MSDERILTLFYSSDSRMKHMEAIRKLKCPLAICLILSFGIVIGCDVFCDFGLISFSFPQNVVSTGHNHEDHHSGGHDHDIQHGHGGHDHGPMAEHHDQTPSGKDCCDDITNRFYSSLANTTIYVGELHVQLFKVLSILYFGHLNLVSISFHLSETQFRYLPNGPPGLNGQLLRVLISSFQI